MQRSSSKEVAPDSEGAIVGQHRSMRVVRRRIELVARRHASVLITGESGVGKELVAREIHRKSARAQRPIVSLNCCALPESLLENELFGHERGAFTGAGHRFVGRFERADGGTLFLDEVGDAPPATQAKLLRVLQEGSFERVGGSQTVHVDVRVVAATNCDLSALRASGAFRDDLYHRLAVFPIRVPSLRERADDVPRLALALCARKQLTLCWTEAALARLASHPWPGNVRELENTIERVAILWAGTGSITLDRVEQALDLSVSPPVCSAPSARERFERDERSQLHDLLDRLRWNVTAAARELGISRGALRYRLRKHGLS